MKEKFKCEKCGKSFARPQSLGVHRKIVHGLKGKTESHHGKKRKSRKEADVLIAKFCPNCGCRLDIVSRALELANAAG
jgi:hypothetical protein